MMEKFYAQVWEVVKWIGIVIFFTGFFIVNLIILAGAKGN